MRQSDRDTADLIVVADIEQTGLDLSSCFTGEACGLFKRMLINMSDQKQTRSFAGKSLGHATPNAAAGAGNESNLSFEFSHRTDCPYPLHYSTSPVASFRACNALSKWASPTWKQQNIRAQHSPLIWIKDRVEA